MTGCYKGSNAGAEAPVVRHLLLRVRARVRLSLAGAVGRRKIRPAHREAQRFRTEMPTGRRRRRPERPRCPWAPPSKSTGRLGITLERVAGTSYRPECGPLQLTSCPG